MKRIVLCFDGTWNKPADENLPAIKQVETNVRRFFESVEKSGPGDVQQAKWYDQGVGSKWYDRYVGGAIGVGLEKNIIDGYNFWPSNMPMAMKSTFSVLAAALIRRGVWWG